MTTELLKKIPLVEIETKLYTSQPQAEPVAWIPPEREGEFHHAHSTITAYRSRMAGWVPVYTHPAAPVPAVPPGYVMVPVEPTPEMCKAGRSAPVANKPYPPHVQLIWDAMIAAAPPPVALTPLPEPVQRLMRFAGKKRNEVSNPCLTARETIVIADWMQAHGITAKEVP